MSPEGAREDLAARVEAIEAGYEFMLAYAAQGLPGDGNTASSQIREYLTRFLNWVEGAGPWGPVLLGVAYVPAAVFLVPGSLLTLGAGAAFGLVAGMIAVSLGSTAGAAAAFLLGRQGRQQVV